MASEKNLHELFHETLKDIYFAEKKILNAPRHNLSHGAGIGGPGALASGLASAGYARP